MASIGEVQAMEQPSSFISLNSIQLFKNFYFPDLIPSKIYSLKNYFYEEKVDYSQDLAQGVMEVLEGKIWKNGKNWHGIKLELERLANSSSDELKEIINRTIFSLVEKDSIFTIQPSWLNAFIELFNFPDIEKLYPEFDRSFFMGQKAFKTEFFTDSSAIVSEFKKTKENLLNVITNFLNIFVIAIRELNKPVTYIIEIGAIFDVYYRLFILPFTIIAALSPSFKENWKVYTMTGVILTSLVSFLGIYVRWLKPCPKEGPFFRKIDGSKAKKETGRELEAGEIKKSILTKKPVLLIGKSGEGKTELVNLIAHMCPEKNIMRIDTTSLAAGGPFNSSTTEKFKPTETTLKDHFNEIIYFFDEIQAGWEGGNKNFLAWLNWLLEKPDCPIILATTEEAYRKLEEQNDVNFLPLVRRIDRHRLRENTNHEVLRILQMFLLENSELPLSEDCLRKIIEVVQKNKENIAVLSKAKNFLEKILLDPDLEVIPKRKLKQLEEEKAKIKKDYIEAFSSKEDNVKKIESLIKEIQSKELEIAGVLKEVTEYEKLRNQFNSLKKIQNLIETRFFMKIKSFEENNKELFYQLILLYKSVKILSNKASLLENSIRNYYQEITPEIIEAKFNSMYLTKEEEK